MVAFQPIEDAGPRLAFGIVHFLRVFITATSPGVVAGPPQEPRRSLDSSSLFKRNPGQDGTMVFRNRFGRKKGFQEIFLIGWT